MLFNGLRSTVAKLLHQPRGKRPPRTKKGAPPDLDVATGSGDFESSHILTGEPILAVCLANFHHSRGPELEYVWPPILGECCDNDHAGMSPEMQAPEALQQFHMVKLQSALFQDAQYYSVRDDWEFRVARYCDVLSTLADLPGFAIPEGGHRMEQGTSTMLILPTRITELPLYAVSTLSSVSAAEVLGAEDGEYTRDVIQKCLVVISDVPCWGLLASFTSRYCQLIFEKRDFRLAPQLMKMMAVTLNCELLSCMPGVKLIDSYPSYVRVLLRRVDTEYVPLGLLNWLRDNPLTYTKTLTDRAFPALHCQPAPPTCVSTKHILTIVKALLLESRILIWGSSSAEVSALIVYCTGILPLKSSDFAINLDTTLVMPYVPLEAIRHVSTTKPCILGTTNSVLIREKLCVDVLVLLPHDKPLSLSDGSSARHIPPCQHSVVEYRNRKLKRALAIGEAEHRLLKSIDARLRTVVMPQKEEIGSDSSIESAATSDSPKRPAAISDGKDNRRDGRRSSLDVSALTSRVLRRGQPIRGLFASTGNYREAILKRPAGRQGPFKQKSSLVKISRGFSAWNLPERLMGDLIHSTDLASVFRAYIEFIARLAAFGGGPDRDAATLTEIVSANQMYYQIGGSSNVASTFWSRWIRTRNFESFLRSNSLPKIAYYTGARPVLGYAHYRYDNGHTYRGLFRRGLRHAHGEYRGTTLCYRGDWIDDNRVGSGAYCGAQLWHVGDWRADVRCGLGYIHFNSCEFYCGEFRDNRPHGQGCYVNTVVSLRYEGQFASGLFHGEGVLKNDTGRSGPSSQLGASLGTNDFWQSEPSRRGYIYKGCFADGLWHGKGILLMGVSAGAENAAWLYIGDFANGALDGSGRCYYADGAVFDGQWRANARISGKFCNPPAALFQRSFSYESAESARDDKAVDHALRVLRDYVILRKTDYESPIDSAISPEAASAEIAAMRRVLGSPAVAAVNLETLYDEGWTFFEGAWCRREANGLVHDYADANLNWTIARGREWQYTGGVLRRDSGMAFQGHGQLMSESRTIDAYWNAGKPSAGAVVRGAAQWAPLGSEQVLGECVQVSPHFFEGAVFRSQRLQRCSGGAVNKIECR